MFERYCKVKRHYATLTIVHPPPHALSNQSAAMVDSPMASLIVSTSCMALTPESWRFVWPIFLHVGVIHLLLNMLAQVTAAAQVEREMGTIPFLIVYMAGGIYGFLLGGNFSRSGIPSVGASGALFATVGVARDVTDCKNACVLVDLLMHWKYEERPKLKVGRPVYPADRQAFLLFVEFLIGFAIGYM